MSQDFTAAKRGTLILIEHEHGVYYVHGERQHHKSYNLARATSVTRDGRVKAYEYSCYGVVRIHKCQSGHTAVCRIVPNDRIDCDACWAALASNEWDSLESCRADVLRFERVAA